MRTALIYITLIILLASCGTSKKGSNSTQANEDKYKAIATDKFGEDVTFATNDPKSFVLCTSEVKGTVHQPRNTLSYMMIRLVDNTIVLEDKLDGATVNWYSETEIEVYRTPGIMRDDQTRDDFITLYNVETGKSYPKKNTEQH